MNKDFLNKEHPIKLNKIEHIIDKIYYRYPILSKTDISIIVKTFFEEIRYILLIGECIKINNFLPLFKIIKYKVRYKDIYKDAFRIKLSTPEIIKNNE